MIDFQRYVLDNGLRVIHNYVPSTYNVVTNILYNTGARDESRELTGIAHLFEHLMFSGSVNVPNYDEILAGAGGRSNAWTSNDFTNFYNVVPVFNIETAFYLESDRMIGLSFDPEALEIQRNVVVEEFKQQHLNRPYGDLMSGLRSALYSPAHPYSWQTIGLTPEHILKTTNGDIRNWFDSHYAPNNAVLSITGNLPYDKGWELVEKWFGSIPARKIAQRPAVDPGFPTEDVVKDMRGDVPYVAMVIAIPMDAYGTHDYIVTDCITDILAAGRSSRLHRNLVADGNGIFIDADSSIVGSEDRGYMMLNGYMEDASEEALVAAQRMLIGQLEALAIPGNVTVEDLERTLNRFASTFTFGNLDPTNRAQNLALAEIHGEDINETVNRQRKVVLDDIIRVVRKLLETPKVILRYLPNTI